MVYKRFQFLAHSVIANTYDGYTGLFNNSYNACNSTAVASRHSVDFVHYQYIWDNLPSGPYTSRHAYTFDWFLYRFLASDIRRIHLCNVVAMCLGD